MTHWQDFFKGKKVTLMGLGLLGRGVGDAEFLARYGAGLIVTDLKSTEELKPSLERLKGFSNITYHLGGHQLEDFHDRDFILKAAGVPLDSLYIAEARKTGVSIEMDASLFAKLAPAGVTLIGVTGTRGKSTTAALIYEILKAAGKRAFLGGNIKDTATLPLLEKVRTGDFVVLELDSWQLQGFGDAKISPHIAVFTTFLPDHMNYYKNDMKAYFEDKALIFRNQKPENHLVVGENIAEQFEWNTSGKLHIAKRADIPSNWLAFAPGDHNRLNASCARAVAKLLKVPSTVSGRVLKDFHGLAGRMELRQMVGEVTYYNDTNATTPDATIAALRALGRGKNVVLIMGGSDKGLDMSGLLAEIPKACKAIVLLSGTGTDKLLVTCNAKRVTQEEDKDILLHATRYTLQGVQTYLTKNLSDALITARRFATKGDVVLFSPAFASFGPPPGGFKNEYDRGEQFNKLLAGL